jgi:hypothetical protein
MTIMPEVYQLKFGVVLGMVVLIDDSSAKEMAIKVAMENNLCLIQGPPGTGKVSSAVSAHGTSRGNCFLPFGTSLTSTIPSSSTYYSCQGAPLTRSWPASLTRRRRRGARRGPRPRPRTRTRCHICHILVKDPFSCTRMARTGLSPRITIGAPMLCSPSGDASATLGTWRWTLSQNTLLHAVHVQRALRRGRLL